MTDIEWCQNPDGSKGKATIWTEKLKERFWSYVDVRGPNECWPWKAGRFGGRYGQFRLGKRKVKAHRCAYELSRGPIPEGQLVLHDCDNPPCCNPAHHFLGNDADNAADREAKGRGARNGTSLPGEANPAAKITRVLSEEIRARARNGESQRSIADSFRLSQSQVGNIVRGDSWRVA
jgi:hypothetical protein